MKRPDFPIFRSKEEEGTNCQPGNGEHELELVEGNADNCASECRTFCDVTSHCVSSVSGTEHKG